MIKFNPVIRLNRLEENAMYGTFGILLINAQVFCVTLEPPDKENIRNVSSIPAQQYNCHRYSSSKYGETFKVMNVPSRSDVLFHAGNISKHTKGCIILAQYFGKLKGNKAVLNSGNTFKEFMRLMKGYDSFHLTILEHY